MHWSSSQCWCFPGVASVWCELLRTLSTRTCSEWTLRVGRGARPCCQVPQCLPCPPVAAAAWSPGMLNVFTNCFSGWGLEQFEHTGGKVLEMAPEPDLSLVTDMWLCYSSRLSPPPDRAVQPFCTDDARDADFSSRDKCRFMPGRTCPELTSGKLLGWAEQGLLLAASVPDGGFVCLLSPGSFLVSRRGGLTNLQCQVSSSRAETDRCGCSFFFPAWSQAPHTSSGSCCAVL